MKLKIVDIKFKAETPIQRIGVILTIIPLLLFVASGLLWNIENEPFIYRSFSGYELVKRNKPQDDEQGFWLRELQEDHAWEKYDKKCSELLVADQEAQRTQIDCSKVKESTPPSKEQVLCNYDIISAPECFITKLEDEKEEIHEWHSSFGDFLEEISESRAFMPLLLSFVFGISLWSGWAGRLKSWIKTGQW